MYLDFLFKTKRTPKHRGVTRSSAPPNQVHIKLIISETSMIKTMIKALLTLILGLLGKCRSTSINQSRILNFESCQNRSRVVIWPLKFTLFIHHTSFAWKHNNYKMFSLVINHATTKRPLLPFCCLFLSLLFLLLHWLCYI